MERCLSFVALLCSVAQSLRNDACFGDLNVVGAVVLCKELASRRQDRVTQLPCPLQADAVPTSPPSCLCLPDALG